MTVFVVIYDLCMCRVTAAWTVIMDRQGMEVRKDNEGIMVRLERKGRLELSL